MRVADLVQLGFRRCKAAFVAIDGRDLRAGQREIHSGSAADAAASARHDAHTA